MINIQVFNREEATRQVPQEPTAVISISTPGDDAAEFEIADNIRAVLYLAFHDIDAVAPKDSPYKCISTEQARQLAEFVKAQAALGITEILVHCDAGISRSPGVAVALEEALNKNKLAYTQYPLHNKLVANRVLEAMRKLGEEE